MQDPVVRQIKRETSVTFIINERFTNQPGVLKYQAFATDSMSNIGEGNTPEEALQRAVEDYQVDFDDDLNDRPDSNIVHHPPAEGLRRDDSARRDWLEG